MGEALRSIPMDWVLAGFFGFVGGVLAAWRFTRRLERFRDAVQHVFHHWNRAREFVRYARNGVFAMITAGLVFLLIIGAVTSFVVARAHAG